MPVDTAEDIAISFKYFGLDPSASLSAAKEAYRRYVKEFHPDLFPKDSPEQKMAAEKLIAANAHFEKLEKFFKEFPEGKPIDEGEARQEPHNDSEWDAWEKQRKDAFEDELKEWKERQAKIEKEKTASRESFRRGKLVRNVRVGLVLITIALWMGWFSELGKLNQEKGAEDERQRLSLQNPSQDSYIDPITHQDVHQMWQQKLEKMRSENGFVNPDERLKEMPGKFIMLLLWSGGVGWLLFSKKGKAIADKYLAEAEK